MIFTPTQDEDENVSDKFSLNVARMQILISLLVLKKTKERMIFQIQIILISFNYYLT